MAGPGVGGMQRGLVLGGSEPVLISAVPAAAVIDPEELSAESVLSGISCLR